MEIVDWWKKWPEANIGIVTGNVSRIIVLDVDGEPGRLTLTAGGYRLPGTPATRTGGGGDHYIYRWPGFECRNFTGGTGETILPKVDFRGDGGLFVAPPSLHKSGKRYEWVDSLGLDDIELADPPVWLLDLIQKQAQGGSKLTPEDWQVDILEGGRNAALARRAGSLLNKIPPGEVLTMLLALNKAHCKPPLSDSEVQAVVESIARAEAAKQAKEAGISIDQVFDLIDKELEQQKGDKKMTPELRSYVKDAVDGIALEGDAIDRATLIHSLLVKVRPLGINRPAIEEEVKKRLAILRDADDVSTLDDAESEPAAVFPGLVDIVEDDAGLPAFLVAETMETKETELRVCRTTQIDGKILCPPDREGMPFLLPRASEVLRWYISDNNRQLFSDLVEYHKAISVLPSDTHYILLAAYAMLTYLQEKLQYIPEIVFEGLPERGKSRTGKGVIYVSYRGIHETTVRDTHLVRYCVEYGSALFLDTMDLQRKIEKEQSEDVILGRFERGQTVRRVLWPERGPYRDSQYYPIFGPTLIATNKSVNHILETRALTINLPEAGRTFNNDVRPETSLPLKERLVAFRARHLQDELPELDKPCDGRLGDITKPIVQVIRMVCPCLEYAMRKLIEDYRQQRLSEKAETFHARVFLAFLQCEKQGRIIKGTVAVADVVSNFNDGLPEEKQIDGRRVGRVLGQIGLQKATRHEGVKVYYWPTDDQKNTLLKSMGLSEETSPTSPTSPMSPDEAINEHTDGDDGDQGEHGDVCYERQGAVQPDLFSDIDESRGVM
jgi:hypothetical protein